MIEFYTSHGSVCATKVGLTLAEKHIEPVQHLLNLRAGGTHTPEYLKLNPNGVVPTLVDDGRVITESTVICEYLEDAYPDPPLRPDGAYERAMMRLWTRRTDAELHYATAKITFALKRGTDMSGQLTHRRPRQAIPLDDVLTKHLDAPDMERYVGVLERTFTDMATQLAKAPWLSGSGYSLAETSLFPYVMRFELLGLSWFWDEDPARAPVTAWLHRCKERPSYRAVYQHIPVSKLEETLEERNGTRAKLEALRRRYYGAVGP